MDEESREMWKELAPVVNFTVLPRDSGDKQEGL
jgi:hypothetical protein